MLQLINLTAITRQLASILTLSWVVVISGCGNGESPKTDEPATSVTTSDGQDLSNDEIKSICENHEPVNYCVLIDFSGVRSNNDLRKVYASNFESLMSEVLPGDVVTVAMITENSISEPEYLLTTTVVEPFKVKKAKNPAMVIKEQKRFVEEEFLPKRLEMIASVKNILLTSDRESPTTDIISAIHLSSSVLNKYDMKERRLLIMSDMEENSPTIQLVNRPPSAEETDKLIVQETNGLRGLPSLKGVKVKVVGAQSPTEDAFFRVRNFWKAYFSRSGAELHDSDYSAAM